LNGCPIGNLSQEMGDLSPPFQAKLKEAKEVSVTDNTIFFAHTEEITFPD
jgi:hypothetical protein